MKLNNFLTQHKVFRLEDLDQYLFKRGTGNRYTRNNLLRYYQNQGRITVVRRGLYSVVSPGISPENASFDAFLLAAKMTPDSVLGYHTALEFHGKAHSVFFLLYYLSKYRSNPVQFRLNAFQAVAIPRALRKKGEEKFGVITQERDGVEIRVTNFERTFVDVLDRPELSGSWEEKWRSLENVEFLDLDQVIKYVQLLDNATTAAKVGFFLEQHKDQLMVGEKYFNALKKLCPKSPHYLDLRKKKDSRLVKEWNLIVPEEILQKTWEEIL